MTLEVKQQETYVPKTKNPLYGVFTKDYQFQSLDVVQLNGLKSKPEWNGLLGEILTYDKRRQRFAVRLKYSGKIEDALLLRKNLRLVFPFHIVFDCHLQASNMSKKKSTQGKMQKQQRAKGPYVPKPSASHVACFVCTKQISKLENIKLCQTCFGVVYCSDKCRDVDSMRNPLVKYVFGNLEKRRDTVDINWHAKECANNRKEIMLQSYELEKIHCLFKFNVLDCEFHKYITYRSFNGPEYFKLRYSPLLDAIDNKIQLQYDRLSAKMRQKVNDSKLTQKESDYLNETFQLVPVMKNWQDYYKFHKLPMNDEICITSANHMTIYHILVNYLKLQPSPSLCVGKNSDDNGKKIMNDNVILIHLVGCTRFKEFSSLDFWSELLHILPGYDFHIMLFGDELNIDKQQCVQLTKQHEMIVKTKPFAGNQSFYLNQNKRDVIVIRNNPMTARLLVCECYNCLYTSQTIQEKLEKKYQIPDIVIGLDSGLTYYYDSWKSMMQRIEQHNIKAVFTDNSMTDMYHYPTYYPNIQHNRVTNPFRFPAFFMLKDLGFNCPRNGSFAVFNCTQ